MRSSKFDSLTLIRSGIENVLDLFTTTNCIVCGNKSFGKRLCPDCEAFLTNSPAPTTKKVNNHDIHYFGFYEEKLRDFILSYKFHNHHSLSSDLAKLASSTIITHKISFDIITYVPATKNAKKRRGYDHVELIAKRISKRIEKPWVRSMEAVRETDQLQTTDRREAVKGKFAIIADVSNLLANKKVLLIDDVLTTGNTIEEASRVLKSASPAEIIRLVIAIKK